MRRTLMEIAIAACAGLLAGPALGLGEWLAVTRLAGVPAADGSALSFAVAAYAVVAALFGGGLGMLGALVAEWRHRRAQRAERQSPSAWGRLARYWVILVGVIGFVVARFRIARDVFDGSLPVFSLAGLIVHAVLIAAPLALAGLVWWLTRTPRRREPDPTPRLPDYPTTRPPDHSTTRPSDHPATRPLPRDPSRRQFLKSAATAGLIFLPPVAALSRMLQPSVGAKSAPSIIRTTGVKPQDMGQRPNIIYLMIDTLRADYLSCYGYAGPISPRIDALAAEGIRFARQTTQGSWTKSCVASQLASLYPSSHRAQYKADRLPDSVTTLPEVLARHGFATAGFAANVNVAPLFNFQQGFHSYEFLSPSPLFGASEAASQLAIYQGLRLLNERFVSSAKNVYNFYYPAEAINERAFDWMSRHLDQRFFLFLHYMDPHDPYFEHPYNGYGIARVSTPDPAPEMADEIKRLYVAEVSYLDRQLGELFDWLKKQGLYDNTMIVLTSDHGEEFHEHGGWWHGYTLYEEVINVPLMIKLPGGRSAGVVDAGSSQAIDIAPTILSALGLPRPAEMQGVDLLNPAERIDTAFAEEGLEGNIMRAVRQADWKYIETQEGNPGGMPTQQLFDLSADPGEQRNLATGEPERVAHLSAEASRVQADAQAHAVATEQTAIDATTLQQLRNIGY